MDLNGTTLAGWLEEHKRDSGAFPGALDYHARYRAVEDWLVANVHSEVNRAALRADGAYLTDHGPQHIQMVIRQASMLAKAEQCRLTPYEVYLLLAAIQLHDVGNIFGRMGHEGKTGEIVAQMGRLFGDDSVEKRWIITIGQAHGGDIEGDRDKIGRLPSVEPILGHPVKIQLLAAILKFADELADGKDRAARFLLEGGGLPRESEAYHKYAQRLHSVMVDTKGREITLLFDVPLNDVRKKFGKGEGRDVYLLDEIFERTLKTHVERMYCARFLRPYIEMDAINVKIEIYDEQDFSELVETIGYRLVDKGYPDPPPGGVHALCPELKDWKKKGRLDIGHLDGDSLYRSVDGGAGESRNE